MSAIVGEINSKGRIIAGNVILTNNDNVGIGTTAPDFKFTVAAGAAVADFNRTDSIDGTYRDFIKFRRGASGVVGEIKTNNSNTQYNTSSDYRLKENVVAMAGAITRLKSLKPRRFNFIINPNDTVDGFLAHEAQAIVPEAVSGKKDAVTDAVLYVKGDELPEGKNVGDVKTASVIVPQGIDQSKLVPLLVGALQEAITRIEKLETATKNK